jgi:hypothetical protein
VSQAGWMVGTVDSTKGRLFVLTGAPELLPKMVSPSLVHWVWVINGFRFKIYLWSWQFIFFVKNRREYSTFTTIIFTGIEMYAPSFFDAVIMIDKHMIAFAFGI